MAGNFKKNDMEMNLLHSFMKEIDDKINTNKLYVKQLIRDCEYSEATVRAYKAQPHIIPQKLVKYFTNLFEQIDELYKQRELLVKIKQGYYDSLGITKQTYINYKKKGKLN